MTSQMNRRDFLTQGLAASATIIVGGRRVFAAPEHRYNWLQKLYFRGTSGMLLMKSEKPTGSRQRTEISFVTSRVIVVAESRVTRVTPLVM